MAFRMTRNSSAGSCHSARQTEVLLLSNVLVTTYIPQKRTIAGLSLIQRAAHAHHSERSRPDLSRPFAPVYPDGSRGAKGPACGERNLSSLVGKFLFSQRCAR